MHKLKILNHFYKEHIHAVAEL